MVKENERTVFVKLKTYGNKFIRNEFDSHLFKDGATMAHRYNAGMVESLKRLISNELHFWY